MLVTNYDYNKLRDRALNVKHKKDSAEERLLTSKATLEKYSNELKLTKEDVLIQKSSIKILQKVIDEMSQEFIKSITDLLSYALQTIFIDEDYLVEIELKETKLGNTAQFLLVDNKKGIRSNIAHIGGGVSSVLGLVLNVFCIMTYKRSRVLFLDESLSAVSDKYIEPLMTFIKQLCEDKGFIFVAILHDPRFKAYADFTYEMNHGKLSLIAKEGVDI